MEDYDSLGARQQPYDVPEQMCIEESVTDYFGNEIQDEDGVFIVQYNQSIYSEKKMLIGFKEASAVLTHDTLTDFLEDETDNYISIDWQGLGKVYKKEVDTI